MTKQIQLSFGSDVTTTAISNIFIDEYMPSATGLQNKVYIYLLRCLGDRTMAFSVASISEKLDETEKDVVRAMKYWDKKKLLCITWDDDGQPVHITVNPLTNQLPDDYTIAPSAASQTRKIEINNAPVPEPASVSPVSSAPVITKPNYSAKQLARFRESDDFNILVDHIEEKLGCTFKLTDLQTPAFLYEDLGMTTELIEYLYDYCIFKNAASPAYIEKVAISWNEKGIDSLSKARTAVFSRSRECSVIKAAFGLNRPFGAIELEFVDRWRNEYGMSPEMITEACNRTMLKTGKPDFPYTDGTLRKWHEAGVTDVDGIKEMDAAHNARSRQSQIRKANQTATVNKFNQFQQRTYSTSDYDDLESRRLGM